MSNCYEELKVGIQDAFGQMVMPKTLFDASDYFRTQNSQEIDEFEKLDWDTVTVDHMKRFYECNTFISKEGYFYLLPKVLKFCDKWRLRVEGIDFIYVYLRIPCMRQDDGFLDNLSLDQRSLVWRFLSCAADLVGSGMFDENSGELDTEVLALRGKLNFV